MTWIRHFQIDIFLTALCCFSLSMAAFGDEPPIIGDFPFEDVAAIYSGPFMQTDHSDLLAVQGVGGLAFESRRGGVGMGVSRLALYSFDGYQFQRVWKCGSLTLEYSLPKDGPISAMTWCCGDFDGDGRYSIITCNVNEMRQYTFGGEVFKQYGNPTQERIETPDVWIDQLIACDINDDGIDELIAMEYPYDPDSSSIYHLGIYRIAGDKPAGKSLVEIWHGHDRIGINTGIMPPDHFISKCHINGISGEMPVIMGSQSDMSPSSYKGVARNQTGAFEIVRPFPKPYGGMQPPVKFNDRSEEGKRRMKEEMEAYRKNSAGPVGGFIFNDGDKILHYGYFLDENAPNPDHKSPDPHSFAVLEGDRWRPLKKTDPSIRGLLCKFTLDPGRTGWLFISDGKYSFYDKLPISD